MPSLSYNIQCLLVPSTPIMSWTTSSLVVTIINININIHASPRWAFQIFSDSERFRREKKSRGVHSLPDLVEAGVEGRKSQSQTRTSLIPNTKYEEWKSQKPDIHEFTQSPITKHHKNIIISSSASASSPWNIVCNARKLKNQSIFNLFLAVQNGNEWKKLHYFNAVSVTTRSQFIIESNLSN